MAASPSNSHDLVKERSTMRRTLVAGLLLFGLGLAEAAGAEGDPPAAAPLPGSTAFCLFEVPTDDGARRRWVNLGIVQYVEAGRDEVRLVFGGGNLGSGHEARIPMASPADALAFVERLRLVAGGCRQGSA